MKDLDNYEKEKMLERREYVFWNNDNINIVI